MENKIPPSNLPTHPRKRHINGGSVKIFYGLKLFQLAEGEISGCWSIGFLMKGSRENSRSGRLRWMYGTLPHLFRCTHSTSVLRLSSALLLRHRKWLTRYFYLPFIFYLYSRAGFPFFSKQCVLSDVEIRWKPSPASQITCTLNSMRLSGPLTMMIVMMTDEHPENNTQILLSAPFQVLSCSRH